MSEDCSPFNGFISGIPDVCVDALDTATLSKTKYCFISSYEKAQKYTCDDCVDNIFITSEATKSLLQSFDKQLWNDKQIKSFSVNQIHHLNQLSFALIPNYYSVGSISILLIDNQKERKYSVFYTGDTRFDDILINAFKGNDILGPYIYGNEKLNCIYLDTSFSVSSELNENVSNNFAIQLLSETIALYPSGTVFKFYGSDLTYSNIWFALQQRFKDVASFNFSESITEKLKVLAACSTEECMINLFKSIKNINLNQTNNIGKYVFNITDSIKEPMNSKTIQIVLESNISKEQYRRMYFDSGSISDEKQTNNLCDRTKIDKPLTSNEKVLPNEVKLLINKHSSLPETINFTNIFHSNLMDVWPCYEGNQFLTRNLSIKSIYGVSSSIYENKRVLLDETCASLSVCDIWNQRKFSIDSNLKNAQTKDIVDGSHNFMNESNPQNDSIISVFGKMQRHSKVSDFTQIPVKPSYKWSFARDQKRETIVRTSKCIQDTPWIIKRPIFKKASLKYYGRRRYK